jgi:short-subunit dehydrogenase
VIVSAARPITLITGASAGIGTALARVFAEHGHQLVLIARREQALTALADEIAALGRPRPIVLALDLARPDAVAEISRALAAQNLEPQFVVNNAGFGLLGSAARLDRAEQLTMIDVNVRVLVELSLAFVDRLVSNKGGILNVASLASFLPGPGMAVYYASKAFVLSFSEALHYELARRGVRVTALCPGPVPTEFQARAGLPVNYEPALLGRSAESVARDGYRALMRGRARIVPGLANKIVSFVPRFLPRSWMLRLVGMAQAGHFGSRSAAGS